MSRLRIIPAGETAPLYTDLWDETTGNLIEAKGGVTREQLRSAIGQLIDYSRFVEAKQRTVLLPSKPRQDLLALLTSAGMGLVYEAGGTFISTSD